MQDQAAVWAATRENQQRDFSWWRAYFQNVLSTIVDQQASGNLDPDNSAVAQDHLIIRADGVEVQYESNVQLDALARRNRWYDAPTEPAFDPGPFTDDPLTPEEEEYINSITGGQSAKDFCDGLLDDLQQRTHCAPTYDDEIEFCEGYAPADLADSIRSECEGLRADQVERQGGDDGRQR